MLNLKKGKTFIVAALIFDLSKSLSVRINITVSLIFGAKRFLNKKTNTVTYLLTYCTAILKQNFSPYLIPEKQYILWGFSEVATKSPKKKKSDL